MVKQGKPRKSAMATFTNTAAQLSLRGSPIDRDTTAPLPRIVRAGSALNIKDISSPYCQQRKKVRMSRLDHYDRDEGEWLEIVVEDRRATPADVAACRLDFAAWLRTLQPKQRRIAKTLATGETTQTTARKFRLSAARVSQLRHELRDAWLTFQGEPVPA